MTRIAPKLQRAEIPTPVPAATVSSQADVAPALQLPDLPPTESLGGPEGLGLPVELLSREVDGARQILSAVAATALPEDARSLAEVYRELGGAVASAEACLLSCLDALDARTGGGVAQPAAGYAEIRKRAFALLREAGHQFDRFEPAFGPLVHGPNAWPNQPVAVREDRGDGRPLYVYDNTYKQPPGLTREQRLAEHRERVDNFRKKGGSFDQIITAEPGTFATLAHRERYDYVLGTDGTLRLHANPPGDEGPPKPGHSLLATGSAEFKDEPSLLAGELWVIKDSAGDVEAVVVANNSGHFKPSFEDLPNATEALEALGIPRAKVIFFGGPNNLPSMMEEIGSNCGLGDLSDLLPPEPTDILARLAAKSPEDSLSVRGWQSP